ncbi:hypothetical protein C1H46_026407 [Malus baccata]|uniref:Uncharacterized protein n=1 Tax=Malus baccata TaxID=106549 RepID=A0A540LNI0_MALBA|nr:hypothetical protein C1H46_026407 [Malus baccata]
MQWRAKEHQDATIAALEFDHLTRKMMHYVEDDSHSPSLAQKFHQTIASSFGDPTTPEILMVLEVTNPPIFCAAPTNVSEAFKVSVEGSGTVSPPLVSHDSLPQQLEDVTPHPPSSKFPGTTQILEKARANPHRACCARKIFLIILMYGTIGIYILEPVSEQTKTYAAATSTILPAFLTEAASTVTIKDTVDPGNLYSRPFILNCDDPHHPSSATAHDTSSSVLPP